MQVCSTERSFGIELEFDDDINPLLSILAEDGALPDRERHRYHCDCRTCRWESSNTYAIKAQRDSSCGGEIITKPFFTSNWEQFHELTNYMETAVLQAGVDAGPRAGSHVHVNIPPRPEDRSNAYAAFLMWHEHVVALAQGRFTSLRPGNNDLVNATPRFNEWVRLVGSNMSDIDSRLMTSVDIRHSLYRDVARIADRHSTLSVTTSTGATWEYRVWNSTCAAWRMRAYVTWSLALSDPDVVSEMLTIPAEERSIERLGRIFLNHGHTMAAGYLNRQMKYVNKIKETI